LEEEQVNSIGVAYTSKGMTDTLSLSKQFTDKSEPYFTQDTPIITDIHSTSAELDVMVNRTATVYYVVAPKKEISTISSDKKEIDSSNDYNNADDTTYIPKDGAMNTWDTHSLNAPSQLAIVNPPFSSQTVKHGSQQFTGSLLRIPLSGLVPNTEYYVYFVLKGVGDVYSKVMAYQFETSPVETPIVTAQEDNPNGVIKTDQESYVYYALVSQSHLADILTANLIDDMDATTLASVKANSTLYTKLKGETVLDSMVTEDGTGKSDFDLYASEKQKLSVQQYISGTGENMKTQAQRVANGEISNLAANTAKAINFKANMTPGNVYYLLVAAKNVYGKEYGFKAVGSLSYYDEIPPEYVGDQPYVVASLDTFTIGDKTELASNLGSYGADEFAYAKFSGSVTVTFSKALYIVSTNDDDVKEQLSVVTSDKPKAGEVSLKSVLGGSIGTSSGTTIDQTVSTSSTDESISYTIHFKNVAIGDQLIFFNSGEICNVSGVATSKKLYLTFNPLLLASKYDTNYFVTDTSPGASTTNSFDIYLPGFSVKW
jgi:hypothetical protein